MKLCELQPNQRVKIIFLNLNKNIVDRLSMLNIYEGATVQFIRFSFDKKNMLFLCDGGFIGVDINIAEKISAVNE